MRGWMLMILALATATPAFAQMPFAGKHDNKQPIEITSDHLDVFQQENKAIFTGHVVAVQGDVHLKSETMVVYYNQADPNEKKPAADKTAKSPAMQQSSIKKIDVDGGVFLTTPEETASGASGIYDVENHKIYLNTDVVLTREKNVLKGDHLVYDFETGKSTLNAPGGNAATPSGRVKAVFIPSDNKPGSNEKLPTKK